MAAGQGFKTFTTGEVLTAGDVNGYLMQGVLVFASAAARDAAITSPQEGQFAFTKDTNGLWYYDGAAWVSSGATGDIEGVTAGIGISGGGTSGTVTVTNSMATAIDAKGDLVAGTGADTFAKLTVGANGTILTADSAEATGLKWAAASGGGKVLQVVAATDDGIASTSSTTFSDTGLTVTITPTLSTSKILVLANIGTLEKDQNYTNAAMKLRLVRGATSILDMGDRNLYNGAVARSTMAQSIAYLDSPATTSATTYKVQYASLNATQTVIYNTYDTSNTTTSSIVVLEIGA